MGKFIDLTGQRFGKLTVIKEVDGYKSLSGRYVARWLCQCDCGETIVTSGNTLRSGNTKSCGCLQRKVTSQTNKKYNTYDLSGEFGIGYTSNGEEFWFDLEDYNKIKDYCWTVGDEGKIITKKNKSTILLHRLILDINDNNIQVDHIRHKRYDNRKSQLRMVNNSQNQMNTSLRVDNTSGYKGVSWDNNQSKWVAYISINKKRKHLGSFDSFENAVLARKKAEEKYQGEYSYDNSMRDTDGE